MTNTPMRSRTTLESRLGAVLHIAFAETNVPSVNGAKYFVTFIDKASGHVSACRMIT